MRAAALALALALSVPSAAAGPRFTDVTAESGLRFEHDAAKSPEKRLPETMGAGVALLDFDLDGDLDVYLVQGKAVVGAPATAGRNELWRNRGDGRFEPVEGAAGAADAGLGMGACHGDVDGDGDPDLFVTNLGADALFLNEGGRFRRAGPEHGIDGESWSASCTFFDADCDGDLDLYVTSYVEYDPATERWCGDPMRRVRSFCHPDHYEGERDRFYRNEGDGRFRDATEEAGFGESRGKGLGVIASDLDDDGDLDLLVANDSTPNFDWRNDGEGRFRETGLVSAFALSERGRALAGMGVTTGDFDGDGRTDAFVTNLDLQTNTLYLSRPGRERFDARGGQSMKRDAIGPVGWATLAFDPDLDGDLDLLVSNGHVIDNIEAFNKAMRHRQADQLFENLGGAHFRLLGPEAGIGLRLEVGRGAAAGDLDGDGDLDLVLTRNDGPARVLRNDSPAAPALVLELVGTRGARDPVGARVELLEAGRVFARAERRGAEGYLSQGSPLVHVACPGGRADVLVHWPSGDSELWTGLAAGPPVRLTEGSSGTALAAEPRSGVQVGP